MEGCDASAASVPYTRIYQDCNSLPQLGDKLDFDAAAKRYLSHAEGASCVNAVFSEYLFQEFAGSIGDKMLFSI